MADWKMGGTAAVPVATQIDGGSPSSTYTGVHVFALGVPWRMNSAPEDWAPIDGGVVPEPQGSLVNGGVP